MTQQPERTITDYENLLEISTAYKNQKFYSLWANGRIGFFVPFEYLGNRPIGSFFRGRDGKGLRFVDYHKNIDYHISDNKIILEGFTEFLLMNWEESHEELIKEYINSAYIELKKSLITEDGQINEDSRTRIKLLNDIRESEITKKSQSPIFSFLSMNDAEKLSHVTMQFFKTLDKYIDNEVDIFENKLVEKIRDGIVTWRWANGKTGMFKDFDQNSEYRFCETTENGYSELLAEHEQRKSPILALGFIGFLIKFWNNEAQNIYKHYYQTKLKLYKQEHKKDADAYRRDLDKEFFERYLPFEKKWIKESEAIFEFLPDKEINRIKEFAHNYLEYINQFSPYKQYTSFDEAFNDISINDKIILHSIRQYCDRGWRLPLDLFNDIMYIRANYKKSPDKCFEYFNKVIKGNTKEYYVIIHILRKTLEKDSDFILLLPTEFENTDYVKNYKIKENENRKRLTVHFDISASYILRDEKHPEFDCSYHSITDEKAIFHYVNHPEKRHLFTKIPADIEKRVEEYKSELKTKFGEENNLATELKSKSKSNRVIEIEKLKEYFNASFKGQGQHTNYFNMFIEEISNIEKPKEIAQIALLIYNGEQKSRRVPDEFNSWYKIFCDCTNSKHIPSYKPSKLIPIPERLEKLFDYLK